MTSKEREVCQECDFRSERGKGESHLAGPTANEVRPVGAAQGLQDVQVLVDDLELGGPLLRGRRLPVHATLDGLDEGVENFSAQRAQCPLLRGVKGERRPLAVVLVQNVSQYDFRLPYWETGLRDKQRHLALRLERHVLLALDSTELARGHDLNAVRNQTFRVKRDSNPRAVVADGDVVELGGRGAGGAPGRRPRHPLREAHRCARRCRHGCG